MTDSIDGRRIFDELLTIQPIQLHSKKSKSTDLDCITAHIAEQIRPHLPPLEKEATHWSLLYSTQKDGTSLTSMLALSCLQKGSMVLCIKDENDTVFGAFASEALSTRKGFFGNGSCFLWKQDPASSKVTVYKSTGENDYHICAEDGALGFGSGGGDFGLWIHNSLLKGHSRPCPTYGNDILSSQCDFDIMVVELWTIRV